MTYDNTNTGILSKNDRKETEKHPDIKGTLNVNGVEYYLAGWLNERKDGTGKFYSLKVTPKKQPQPIPQRTSTGNSYAAAAKGEYGVTHDPYGLDDSEIPF